MIDIALFGLGRIGIMHGKNLMRNKDFNLKYIYDIEEKLSKKYSKTLKTKAINNPSVAYKDKNIKAIYSLQENRKFNLNHLKALKAKKYIEKITV